jgi:hypothetical protein
VTAAALGITDMTHTSDVVDPEPGERHVNFAKFLKQAFARLWIVALQVMSVSQRPHDKATAVVVVAKYANSAWGPGESYVCRRPDACSPGKWKAWLAGGPWVSSDKTSDPRVIFVDKRQLRETGSADHMEILTTLIVTHRSSADYAQNRFIRSMCATGATHFCTSEPAKIRAILEVTVSQADTMASTDDGRVCHDAGSDVLDEARHKPGDQSVSCAIKSRPENSTFTVSAVRDAEHTFRWLVSQLADNIEQVVHYHGESQGTCYAVRWIAQKTGCGKRKGLNGLLPTPGSQELIVVLLPYSKLSGSALQKTILQGVRDATSRTATNIKDSVLFETSEYHEVAVDTHRGYPLPVRVDELMQQHKNFAFSLRKMVERAEADGRPGVHLVLVGAQVHSLLSSIGLLLAARQETTLSSLRLTMSILVDPVDCVQSVHVGHPFISLLYDRSTLAHVGMYLKPRVDVHAQSLLSIELQGSLHCNRGSREGVPLEPGASRNVLFYATEQDLRAQQPDAYAALTMQMAKCSASGWKQPRVFTSRLDQRVCGSATRRADFLHPSKPKGAVASLFSVAQATSAAQLTSVYPGDRCLFVTSTMGASDLYAILSRMQPEDKLYVISPTMSVSHPPTSSWNTANQHSFVYQ